MSTKHTPVQWEIVDSGSPDYLDGIEAQFQIKDGDKTVAFVFSEERLITADLVSANVPDLAVRRIAA